MSDFLRLTPRKCHDHDGGGSVLVSMGHVVRVREDYHGNLTVSLSNGEVWCVAEGLDDIFSLITSDPTAA